MSAQTRREFLIASGCLAAGATMMARGPKGPALGGEFEITEISGKPRQRGERYGMLFMEAVAAFLDREIYKAFIGHPSPKDSMLRYAEACGKAIRAYSPVIHDELEGVAKGAGIRFEEAVLLTLHEELYHKGVLPKVPHCTAVAVGPPDTADGRTYVGQTWDWMPSVARLSTMLHWKRPEGPSLLAYAYPGLWVGAGLNSAGLALCWTSADLGRKDVGARVGIPSYVLLTHLLYQETLKDAIAEAKRATQAGWFTFVMADGRGNLVNIEGSPLGLVVEEHKGRLARVLYGSRKMTGTEPGATVKLHPRCQKMYDLLAASKGKTDRASLQRTFADKECGIQVGASTLDLMVYDTTAREAHLSRGPSYGVKWKTFRFDKE